MIVTVTVKKCNAAVERVGDSRRSLSHPIHFMYYSGNWVKKSHMFLFRKWLLNSFSHPVPPFVHSIMEMGKSHKLNCSSGSATRIWQVFPFPFTLFYWRSVAIKIHMSREDAALWQIKNCIIKSILQSFYQGNGRHHWLHCIMKENIFTSFSNLIWLLNS